MGISPTSDEAWMRYALRLAQRAEQQGEVPVGAILVKDDKCIAEGWNASISQHDPSAHAEIIALREAGKKLANYRLVNTTLYVTLEPCVMCMGAISQARISRLVFGAADPKRGAVFSAIALADASFLNHRIAWQNGVLASECATLLKDFFRARR
ncbi:tRNA-specific adenosine deaminase [Crenothrix polyspora]|uniref:tRNA-specific adenosine deaminase n=1 Tax=Crenothrix polyspora TaxID=360316 RepID=A0A1R4HHV6_9GAMM|nr:tRNA adenosine(34) deaminase TadA [Crenothrix polyspora]SJM95803.1 tRNA-specific adenosine deaminase [Crenothrix polyspora]